MTDGEHCVRILTIAIQVTINSLESLASTLLFLQEPFRVLRKELKINLGELKGYPEI